jgi:uncharacterized protein
MRASLDPRTPVVSPLKFFALVLALSIAFWVLGAVSGLEVLPGLSVSALGAFSPLTAAAILVYRESNDGNFAGVVALLKRSFDFRRINAKAWYVPIVLLMPGLTAVSIGWLHFTGVSLPSPRFSVASGLVMFAAFFIGALGEELGWSGYLTDPLQNRLGALGAGILLGVAWAAWHVIPYMQAHRSVEWMGWYALFTVATRVVMVWLFNNTGKSVFGAALFHAMLNLSWFLFSDEYFDPRIVSPTMVAVAAVVVMVWGPKSLSRNRFAKPREH